MFEKILKANPYRHPETGSFIKESDAASLAEEHNALKDKAKAEIDKLKSQGRGTYQGAAEADSPADHFAAVSFHAQQAAKYGSQGSDDARKAHTAAALAHYKAGATNSKSASEAARSATQDAAAKSKGQARFTPVPVRKSDLMGFGRQDEQFLFDRALAEVVQKAFDDPEVMAVIKETHSHGMRDMEQSTRAADAASTEARKSMVAAYGTETGSGAAASRASQNAVRHIGGDAESMARLHETAAEAHKMAAENYSYAAYPHVGEQHEAAARAHEVAARAYRSLVKKSGFSDTTYDNAPKFNGAVTHGDSTGKTKPPPIQGDGTRQPPSNGDRDTYDPDDQLDVVAKAKAMNGKSQDHVECMKWVQKVSGDPIMWSITKEHIGWDAMVGKLKDQGHSQDEAEKIAGSIAYDKYGPGMNRSQKMDYDGDGDDDADPALDTDGDAMGDGKRPDPRGEEEDAAEPQVAETAGELGEFAETITKETHSHGVRDQMNGMSDSEVKQLHELHQKAGLGETDAGKAVAEEHGARQQAAAEAQAKSDAQARSKFEAVRTEDAKLNGVARNVMKDHQKFDSVDMHSEGTGASSHDGGVLYGSKLGKTASKSWEGSDSAQKFGKAYNEAQASAGSPHRIDSIMPRGGGEFWLRTHSNGGSAAAPKINWGKRGY